MRLGFENQPELTAYVTVSCRGPTDIILGVRRVHGGTFAHRCSGRRAVRCTFRQLRGLHQDWGGFQPRHALSMLAENLTPPCTGQR